MILLAINNNPIGVIISVFAVMMLQPHSPHLAIMSSFQLVLNQTDYDKLSIGLFIDSIFAAVSKA